MNFDSAQIHSETESVCPECLARLPAYRIVRGDDVYLAKHCPAHGDFETIIWRGQPAFTTWVKPKTPSYPKNPFTPVERGCPFDCGLCPDHRQQSCCVLLEVTQRCDLKCPVCFADANNKVTHDPDMATIEHWYRRLLDAGGPFNVQLSGGEPCVRDDLPEIISLGRSLGFSFFQINTNGLRLARDVEFVKRLRDAGASTIFMQFDGTHDEIFAALRGRALLDQKRAAIEQCIEHDLGVVLVPTVVPGINADNIGDTLKFALHYAPGVRGVHFQPISYFGRYPQPPGDANRITIPEIIRALAEQSGGMVKHEQFVPPGGENALCSFHGNFVVMPDGALKPLTKHNTAGCCSATPAALGAVKSREFVARQWTARPNMLSLEPAAPAFGEWDIFIARAKTHTFCISGMAFQDAWNLDLERLRECYIHNVSGDAKLIPFCAYNLTDAGGHSLYRNTIIAQ